MPVFVRKNLPIGTTLEVLLRKAKIQSAQTIGAVMEARVKRRFQEQGPGWTPLSDATAARKGSTEILIDTGLLQNMIESRVDEINGTIKTGIFNESRALIALVHELGSPVRGIPKRPFLVPSQDELENEVVDIIIARYKLVLEAQL